MSDLGMARVPEPAPEVGISVVPRRDFKAEPAKQSAGDVEGTEVGAAHRRAPFDLTVPDGPLAGDFEQVMSVHSRPAARSFGAGWPALHPWPSDGAAGESRAGATPGRCDRGHLPRRVAPPGNWRSPPGTRWFPGRSGGPPRLRGPHQGRPGYSAPSGTT